MRPAGGTAYRFELLTPLATSSGASANEAIFARGPVLGIEVTVPALALRCSAGNIDPQHTEGDTSRAAIEDALIWPIPVDGTLLATVRADLDSLGAMAVLSLRAGGIGLSPAALDRVHQIAVADKFAHGTWRGPRPLSELWGGDRDEHPLGAIGCAVMDASRTLAERVGLVADWIIRGAVPDRYRERASREAADLRAELERGETTVDLRADERIAVVESGHRSAVRVGYCRAPVVIARNPAFRFQGGAPHLKYTIAQFTTGYVDLGAVAAALRGREPGWGGSPTIIGSPQGRASEMSLDEILGTVQLHLAS